MAKAEASVKELVDMIERGELRLPEMQRQYAWRSTRVRDLLDSLYQGFPSGAILLWETDEAAPPQDFAVTQQNNPYSSARLLLDGQQRLTSLSAVNRREPVGDQSKAVAFFSTHPRWETREQKALKAHDKAMSIFNAKLPNAAKSPGGLSPAVANVSKVR